MKSISLTLVVFYESIQTSDPADLGIYFSATLISLSGSFDPSGGDPTAKYQLDGRLVHGIFSGIIIMTTSDIENVDGICSVFSVVESGLLENQDLCGEISE